MRRRLLTFLLLAGLGVTAPALAQPDAAALMRFASSVLKVEVIRMQGGYSLGSGVVIGADRVVTNCHVTREARQIAVLQAGLRLPARSQQVDAYHDLCLLNVPGVDAGRAVAIGRPGALAIGQEVTAVGHTAGALHGNVGVVLALHRMDGSRVIQSSNFFNSGASGGGLFDAQTRLIGILTFRMPGGTARYFATPVDWLARLRDDQTDGQQIGPLAGSGRAFWEPPADAQPTFLRAAALEADANWAALQPLTADWAERDASDPEPWYLLGLALARQDRRDDARLAFECALANAPDFANARDELARVGPPRDEANNESTQPPPLPCRRLYETRTRP